MNEYLSIGTLHHMYLVMVAATVAVLFWMLETVLRNEKRKVIIVLILPPLLLYYIYKYWEEMRFKCFFAGLLFLIMVFISVVSKYNFVERIAALLQLISIWPYYVVIHWVNSSSSLS